MSAAREVELTFEVTGKCPFLMIDFFSSCEMRHKSLHVALETNKYLLFHQTPIAIIICV